MVDPSRGMMGEARRKGVHGCVRGRAECLPFRPACVDSALFVEMLHLMPRWVDAIHELGRVAHDRVIAVVKERTPDGRRIYLENRARVCGPTGRLDEGVRAFRRMLPPSGAVHVRTTTQKVDLAEVVDGYVKQGYLTAAAEGRVPKDLPPWMEKVSRAARQEVQDRFGPGPVEQVERVDVIMWPSHALRNFAQSGTS